MSSGEHGAHTLSPWQDGSLATKAKLLVAFKSSSPFFPHLIYSMTCMTLLVVNPERFAKHLPVRFGIYIGVLLSFQYAILVFFPEVEGPAVVAHAGGIALLAAAAIAVPLAAGAVAVFLARVFGTRNLLKFAAIGAGLVAFAVVLANPLKNVQLVLLGPPMFAYFACLVFGTFWAAAAYGVMSMYLLRNQGIERRFGLLQLFGAVTWVATYLASWRLSITLMLDEYAKLPTENPNCYIATAAARGHRRFVGSEMHVAADGRQYVANAQLRYLKCAERVMAMRVPSIHRACRVVYDRLGPTIAARLENAFLADLAYLSLKPAEWLARTIVAAEAAGKRRP